MCEVQVIYGYEDHGKMHSELMIAEGAGCPHSYVIARVLSDNCYNIEDRSCYQTIIENRLGQCVTDDNFLIFTCII